jgi:hypothetical protein
MLCSLYLRSMNLRSGVLDELNAMGNGFVSSDTFNALLLTSGAMMRNRLATQIAQGACA